MAHASLFDIDRPLTRAGIVPRDYQVEAHDGAFRLWDSGEIGVIFRLATGTGKTLASSLCADSWLRRSPNHRFMVLSYETQLVNQFAEELHDYLGVKPGIEMDIERASASDRIVVASRASLHCAQQPTPEQVAELASYGVTDLGAVPARMCETYLRHLRKHGDVDSVRENIAEKNAQPEASDGIWSRLHKFDWRLNWLVCYDECHRHARKLVSVSSVADWFERNPNSRRLGLSATPRRTDNVSIGHNMFPGIAVDYPLYGPTDQCAVKQGYAVPYVQKYIKVTGVDFKNIKRVSEGGDFDEAALAAALGEEGQLAKLCGPMLDMVGDRKTLVFSPSVKMAKDVAAFVNVRVPIQCVCGVRKWYPRALVGDGAKCECGQYVAIEQAITTATQARSLDGGIPHDERKGVYRGFENGDFQFLSVCNLAREGFNVPGVACVAVFRPVSKKASALAEQMKGRACRPLREIARILHTLPDAAARCRAIAESSKPFALIIDLVGITGLEDCASTVEIYAEGLPDVVKQRAEQILLAKGMDEEADVEDAVAQAAREDAEAKERARQERLAAEEAARKEYERRSKADAQARYETSDVGHSASNNLTNPNGASGPQLKFIRFLGLGLLGIELSKKQAGRVISLLRSRKPLEEVARQCGLKEGQWCGVPPSQAQVGFMTWKGVPPFKAKSGYDASLLIDAKLEPATFERKKLDEIKRAKKSEDLDAVGHDLMFVRSLLPAEVFEHIVAVGRAKREQVEQHGDAWDGEEDAEWRSN